MVKFSEIINASIEWTGTVLFRPFSPKKWLILTFIALWAGAITGGSWNVQLPGAQNRKEIRTAEASEVSQSTQTIEERINEVLARLGKPAVITLFVMLDVLIVSGFILLMWLGCRFAFIFLENVVKNDASIKIPFRENKILGNSLFLFSLASAAVFLFLLGVLIGGYILALVKLGVFSKSATIGIMKIILVSLPFLLVFLCVLFIAIIIYSFTHDFVLAVMFKDKIRIMQAWPKIIALMKAHKSEMVKYVLLKIGLGICSGIIGGILSLIAMMGLLLPLGLVAGVFYIIYLILPQAQHFFYFIILGIVGIPTLSFLIFGLMCLQLPFAVFFRSFSLKFLGRLKEHYNLFALHPKTEVIL
jgi:hypothetical protein